MLASNHAAEINADRPKRLARKRASERIPRCVLAIGTAANLFFYATQCWATSVAAALPWDQTLIALQDMLVNVVAPAAIALAFFGAVILYTLGGRDKQAGRLVGSGIGGCIALAFVRLLNYVLP